MNPLRIIARKRDKEVLSKQEITAMISAYTEGTIPDYQMSAFAMAVFLNGMTTEETLYLTSAMLDSGTRLSFPADMVIADKHSTGGVGDKVSLALAPLLACCGIGVPMISGRGLGLTGGTLDKLESIPGFRTELELQEITDLVRTTGCVICGTTDDIAPADRKLYRLRDVTGTVESIPLITASILSKKLAESPDALIFDVKFGSGAVMHTIEQAKSLSMSLVDTAKAFGVPATAVISDMDQPLGQTVGNLLEVEEAIQVCTGNGDQQLTELILTLASELLALAGNEISHDTLREKLGSGEVLQKFQAMVSAQGGDLDALDKPVSSVVATPRPGVIKHIDAGAIGRLVADMGGNRRIMTDVIDHNVGVRLLVKAGDEIEMDQPLAELYHPKPDLFASRVQDAVAIGDSPVTSHTNIREIIRPFPYNHAVDPQ